MAPTASPESLPFDEAIAYFRDKVNLPTEGWTDLMGGMHSRAFVVAGAQKSELLADLRGAVDQALAEGTTLADFRREFKQIVARHGWSHKGEPGWRTATIFETNLRTAHAAGRYKEMTDPAVLAARPYWRYIGGLSVNPRQEHMEWSGTILPADDPWWSKHYPPNGWGCKCMVTSVSEGEMERDGLRLSPAPGNGTVEWTDPQTGEVRDVPKGVDPGWDYNPGEAAWGRRLSDDAMAAWRKQGAAAFESLTPETWENYGLEPRLEPLASGARPDHSIPQTREGVRTYMRRLIGGDEKVYTFADRDHPGFRHDVLVNADSVAGHVDPDRAAFLPVLGETIESPQEVWAAFERHRGTGRVILRQRFIRAAGSGETGMLAVAQARGGVMEAWTVIPTGDWSYLNKQRSGRLVWKR